MSIFPYVYFMVKSFEVASNDTQIALYAGMVTSAFTLAEFSTSMMWGRLSDRVGRKPILLFGLLGTGISITIFGFAQNLQVALLARALGGLLNGNIGVLQSTVGEVVHNKEQRARAFSIMPCIWCLGTFIGSGLGGSLAEPVKNYPGLFSPGSIFETYPFLLPNLVSAGFVLFGVTVGFLFLEETHEKKKCRRDIGLEIGQWLSTGVFRSRSSHDEYSKLADANLDETVGLMQDNSVASTPRLSNSSCDDRLEKLPVQPLDPEAMSLAKPNAAISAINKNVLLDVVAYGILAGHTIVCEQLLPVLMSMEPATTRPKSAFQFLGGFGFSSKTIGLILSAQGIYQMIVQLVLYPKVQGRFGTLNTFRFAAFTYPLLYLLIPYMALLPPALRTPGLFLVFVWKVTHQTLALPSNLLLLNNAAPSTEVVGLVHGMGASAASLSRAIGPTVAGLVQVAGLNAGYLGLPWWTTAAVAVVGAVECCWIEDTEAGEQKRSNSIAPSLKPPA
ncbi:MAG: hypothetical protein M1831_001905 [Alyxoria varia]|nr:MAG: hypothetical protein M1831_001905 [Alyxoria varia]